MQNTGKAARSLRTGIAVTLVAGSLGAAFVTSLPAAQAATGPACATPSKDGTAGNITGVVNTYYPVTASLTSAATSLSVGTPTGSTSPVAAGDELLVIQVQGATVNTANSNQYGAGDGTGRGATAITAGTYEYVRATGPVANGAIPIVGGTGAGLINNYSQGGSARVEIIRVPQYASATLTSGLTASAWNGTSGGILALDVSGTLALGSATVSLTGLGFRGGAALASRGATAGAGTDYVTKAASAANGEKGEGYAGSPTLPPVAAAAGAVDGYTGGDFARGAPGNAGGGGTDADPAKNDQNDGGGGGGNGGVGGVGGNSWSSNQADGGIGGAAYAATDKAVVLGGGGGAGTNNDGTTSSAGAAGGGLILLRAGTTSGTGTITANGSSAPGDPQNDGGGGGGAGGSVVVTTPAGGSLTGLTVNAVGGAGGNSNTNNKDPHGPGGGGGGGWIITSGALAASSAAAGPNGTSVSAAGASIPYGAGTGSGGQAAATATATDPTGVNSGAQCLPKAVNDSGSTVANSVLNGPTVLTNDSGQTITVTSSTVPTHGKVTVAANGTYVYTPTTGYSGPDSFTYTITDSYGLTSTATVNLTVTPLASNDIGTTPVNTTLSGASVLTNDAGTTLTPALTSQASHGMATLNTNGTYSYVPTTGYSGPDSFTYTVTDASNQTAVATVNLTVTPTGVTDAYTTPFQTAATVTPAANDLGTGDVLTAVTGGTKGTPVLNANGSVTYTPKAGASGTDTFTYLAKDAAGQVYGPVTVTVTITPPTAPSTVADSGTTPVNTTLNGSSVLDNDTGVGLTVTSNTQPGNGTGTVTVATNGTYTFVPPTGFSGVTTFTYVATDAAGQQSAPTTVTITVSPTGVADAFTVPFQTATKVTPVTNDLGTGDVITSVANGSSGSASLNSDGSVTYTPNAGFAGTDSFTYRGKDGAGSVYGPTTVTITVPKPQPPVAGNDNGATPVNTTYNGTTRTNDTGTGITVTSSTQPGHGSVTLAKDGTYSYVPATGFSGTDSFTYTITDAAGQTASATVTLSVTPRAVNDTGTTPVNVTLAGASVLSNDLGTGLTAAVLAQPGHGSVTVAGNGTYSYAPMTGFSGPDSFTYTATDSAGQKSTATVNLTVTPTGVADSYAVPFQTATSLTPAANDLGSGDKVTTITQPAKGKAVLNSDGTLTYTPNNGFAGTDTFTYTGVDSGPQAYGPVTVTLTVAKPTAPVANTDTGATTTNVTLAGPSVLGNDTGTGIAVTSNTNPSHGTVTVSTTDGTYSYVPMSGYSGTDSFTYTITDAAGQSAGANVNITVKPTGVADSYTVPFQTATALTVAGNDLGTGDVATSATKPTSGGAVVNADGTVTYTPNAGFAGTDSFTYQGKDASGQAYGPVTVAITVSKPAKPVTTNDTGTTPVNATLAGPSVLTNDTGTGLAATVLAGPANGKVTVKADGTYSYVPTTGYSGPDSFTYTATDAAGQSATGTVNLSVTPTGVNDSYTTPFQTATTVTPASNDLGTGDKVTSVGTPGNGTATANADGTVTYLPKTGFFGTDTFTYTGADKTGQTYGPVTVTVIVQKPAAPVTANDKGSTPVATTLNGASVLTNDTGTGLTATVLTQPGHGSVTVNGDGTYVYTPTTAYSGLDSFTYTATDIAGQTATGTVTITVTPKGVNDAYSTPFQTATTVTPASNDLGTGEKVSSVGTAANGTVALNADGSVTYTPKGNFYGTDTFTYLGADSAGTAYGPVTVTVTVAMPTPPTTTNDSGTTSANVTLAGTSVLANDKGTGLTASVLAQPGHGSVTVKSDGTYSYVPTTGYSGPDSFTYTATDAAGQNATGTVTLTVTPTGVADAYNIAYQSATLLSPASNDLGSSDTVTSATKPANGTTSVSNGTVTYTPKAGFTGVDTFTYLGQDTDKQSYGPVTVTLTVAKPNAPVANNDTGTTPVNTTLSGVSVLGNDTGTGLTVVSNTKPTHGTVTVNTNGAYSFVPTTGYSGTDTFSYTAQDSAGQSASAIVNLSITPTGVADSTSTAFQTPVTISPAANDLGSTDKVSSVTAGGNGATTLNTDGTVSYTPKAGYFGTDTFTYLGKDASGQSYGPVTVTVVVAKPTPPTTKNDLNTTPVNTSLSGPSVLTNDTGTGLTASLLAQAMHGTATVNSDGTYGYVPTTGYSGPDSYTYTATDAAGQTASGTVNLTVTPKGVNDSYTTPFQTPVTVKPTGNDLGLTLTITTLGTPSNGGTALNSDGSVTYTPNAGFAGTDTFTYSGKDASGQTYGPVTVNVTVAAPGAPTAVNDAGSTPANVTLSGASVLANDTGTGLKASLLTQATNGQVTLKADGTYVYVPTTGYSGPDTFTYTATDAAGQTATATVNLSVTPVANPDSASTATNLTLAGASVLTNDVGKGLTASVLAKPTHGSVTMKSDGTYSYVPTTGYSGPDSFTYSGRDSSGQTSTGTVTIAVRPVANPDSGTVATNATLSGASVTANDLGSGLTVTSYTQPSQGTLSVDKSGTYTYTPTTGYSGPDAFTYVVTDSAGQSATGTVSLAVTPVGVADSYSTAFEQAMTFSPASNDLGSTDTITLITGSANDTVKLNANGSVSYTPKTNFFGTDTLTYLGKDSTNQVYGPVTVTVLVGKPTAPAPANDKGNTVVNGTLNGTSVLANDMGTGLTVTANSQPANGSLNVASDGTYTYVPTNGFSGKDSFIYTATDVAGQTGTATVSITVAPQGTPDTYQTPFQTPVTVSPAANDLGSGDVVTSVTNGANGTTTLAANGTVTYTPTGNFTGTDTFTYFGKDAAGTAYGAITVTVTVAKPGLPVANNDNGTTPVGTTLAGASVLANDKGTGLTAAVATQPSHGAVTMKSDGTYSYVPANSSYSGPDSFTYTATDAAGQTASATVNISVTPVGVADAYGVSFGTPKTLTPTSNDLGTGDSIVSVTTPANGSATLNADGTVTYTPKTNFYGTDTFTYLGQDAAKQGYGPVTVTLTVAQPGKPAASNDLGSTTTNVTLNGSSVLTNDTGTSLTASLLAPAGKGKVTLAANGTYTYVPTTGYSGPDSFSYTATDPAGQTSTATVAITVLPTGTADSFATAFATPQTVSPAANDLGSADTVTAIATKPANGTAVVNSDETVTYTPAATFTGTDTFTYSGKDSSGQAYGPTTVTVSVSPPSKPTAAPDNNTTPVNTTLAGSSVLTNDSGTGLTATVTTQPTNGTVTMKSDGTYSYQPKTGFSGSDPFTYTATDAAGQTSQSTVTIAVTPTGVTDSYPAGFQLATTLNPVQNDLGSFDSIKTVSSDSHATVVLNGDGTISYTSKGSFTGTDTFTYSGQDASGQTYGPVTVTVTVSAPTPPALVNDKNITAANATLAGSSVLANDGGTALTVTAFTQPAHGTVTVNSDGSYTYLPSGTFSGPDTFTYTATDAANQSAKATVTITVTPVGVADAATVPFQTPTVLTVLTNDQASGPTLTSVTQPGNGKTTPNADGTVTYSPNAGFTGTDTFTYQAKDASSQAYSPTTVTVTVAPPARPTTVDDTGTTPVNVTLAGGSVLGNDTGTGLKATLLAQATSGTVTMAADGNGTYSYQPAPGYSGPDSFTYTATDAAGQTATGTVTLTVTPTGVADSAAAQYQSPVILNPAANDLGTGDSVTALTTPANGNVVLNKDGSVTYTPTGTFTGTDTFTYQGKDNAGQAYGPVTVTVKVSPPGAPMTNPDTNNTAVNTTLNAASVLANDTGTGLTVSSYTKATSGTVSVKTDGTYTYVPVAGFSGQDSFTYTAKDTAGQTASATVTITVTPVGVADTASVAFQSATVLTPGGNDLGTGDHLTSVAKPVNGNALLNSDGTVTYTAASGYTGTDTFTYFAADKLGTTYGPVTVSVKVNPPTAPVAKDDTGTIAVNGTLKATTVTANDTGTGITVTSYVQPAHGSVSMDPTGTYTYVPGNGYSGPDSFTYTITDAAGQTATATVRLAVTPTGMADTVSAGFQAATVSALAANDLGSGDKVFSVSTPAHGTATLNADGTVTYTPVNGFTGPDTFTYSGKDSSGQTYGPVTVSVTVGTPGAPTTTNDKGSTPVNTTLAGSSVLANDTGTGLTVTDNTKPTHGTVTVAANGTYSYVPTTGYSGPDNFTYTATDAAKQSVTGTVTLSVTPVGSADTVTVPFGTATSLPVASNDLGSNDVATSVTGATHGTLAVNPDGSITYTPAATYAGPDSFTYNGRDAAAQTYGPVTVTVTVAKPAIPVATAEKTTTTAGSPVTLTVLSNDTGTGKLTPAVTTGAANGTAVVNSDGTVTYTPATGFSGTDTFAYTAGDTYGQSSVAVTDTVVVTPVAAADSASTGYQQAYTANGATLTANDSGRGLTVTSVSASAATKGAVALNADGTFTYTPAAGFTGSDTFTYIATDSSGQSTQGTVTIGVATPAPPKASGYTETVTTGGQLAAPVEQNLLSKDSGTALKTAADPALKPAHGTLVVNTDGSYTYKPDAGYSGADSFGYIATDSAGQSAKGTVSISVTPTAGADAIKVAYGTAYTANTSTLLANDSGSVLTVTAVANGSNGKAVLNGDGTYTYTPNNGFSGTDSFSYTDTDNSGQKVTGTVNVTVLPPKPVAVADTEPAVNANVPQTVSAAAGVLVNDNGAAPLTVTPGSATVPTHGTLGTGPLNKGTVNPDGSFTYTPANAFSGTDSFTYTVTDAAGQVSAPGTVTLTVRPVALADAQTLIAGQTLTASTPAPIGTGTFTVQRQTPPTHGLLTLSSSGTYSYTPTTGFTGTDSFSYTVTGAGGVSQAATVTITVTRPSAPVGMTDTVNATAGSPVSVTSDGGASLLTNDSGVGLSVPAGDYTQPTHGKVTVATNGTFTYTPAAGYSGPDSFTYTPVDETGQAAASSVPVSVSVAPVANPASESVAAGSSVTFTLPAGTGTGPFTVTVATPNDPSKGTLTANPNGSFTYTAAAASIGSDSFTYTVTDASTTVSAPAAVSISIMTPGAPKAGDDSYATAAGTTLTVAGPGVLVNDSGDGPLTPTVVPGSALGGTPTIAKDGTLTFVPTPGTSGMATFSYTVTDASAGKQISAPARVTVLVSPDSQPDSYVLTGGTAFTAATSLLANDDGSGLDIVNVTKPAHGSTPTLNPTGTFGYTPETGYSGSDNFTYQVKDSSGDLGPVTTVTLTVGKPAPPVGQADSGSGVTGGSISVSGVLANDAGVGLSIGSLTTPAHGTVTGSPSGNGTFVYNPASGFSGSDSFTYIPVDAYLQPGAPVTVTVTVDPAAAPDSRSVQRGTTLNANTPTPTGSGPFTYTVTTQPSHGTFTLDPTTGAYSYAPAAGFLGPDGFAYTVTDAAGGTSLAAAITLTVVNPGAPVGAPDTGSTAANTPLAGTGLLSNDSGTGAMTAAMAAAPAHGNVTVNPDGSYLYTPAAGYSGVDVFTYTAADSFGQTSAPVPVRISVRPQAVADAYSLPQDTTLSGPSVLGNDTGSGLSASLAAAPAHGTLTLAPDGTFTYTPKPGYVGGDSFTYVAVDSAGNRSQAVTVNLTVAAATAVIPVPAVVAPAPPTPGVDTITQVGTPLHLPKLGGTVIKVTGHLPPGIHIAGQTLVGIPTRVGSYTANVTVKIHGRKIIRKVTIYVRPPNPVQPGGALAFTGAPVPVGRALGLGLGLMLLGGLLVLLAGRRRPRRG